MKYRCSNCGKESATDKSDWGENGWSWYGSLLDVDDGNPVLIACSRECRRKLNRYGTKKALTNVQKDPLWTLPDDTGSSCNQASSQCL